MAHLDTSQEKKKHSAPKYWIEIKGRLCARLQYKTDNGTYKVKYKSITEKRVAKRVVREMRRELQEYGENTLRSDKLTFRELSDFYARDRVVPAEFSNGVKVSPQIPCPDPIVY
jgi:hypothetical protein